MCWFDGVVSWCLQEIQSEFGLHEQVTAQMEQGLDIDHVKAFKKIFFECLEGALDNNKPALFGCGKEPVDICFQM